VSAAALPPPAALAHVRTVRVGTRNGPKLEAVRSALAAYVEGVSVVGHAVESGVPEQPVGWAEIVGGACDVFQVDPRDLHGFALGHLPGLGVIIAQIA